MGCTQSHYHYAGSSPSPGTVHGVQDLKHNLEDNFQNCRWRSWL